MEEGGAVSAGRSRSRAASTVRRSSSMNGGSFIAAGNWSAAGCRGASRFGLPLGIERLGGKLDRKSTRLNSSHRCISYAVFCLKKKKEYSMNYIGKHNYRIS